MTSAILRKVISTCIGLTVLAGVGLFFPQNANASTIDPVDQKWVTTNGTTLYGPFDLSGVTPPSTAIFVGEDSSGAAGTTEARGIAEFDIQTIASSSNVLLVIENAGIPPAITGGCFSYSGCPEFTSPFNVYGFTGNGAVDKSDFNQTSNFLGALSLPSVGSTVSLNVSALIASLIGGSNQYAGFVLDATSNGGAFLNATLEVEGSVVPLPAALPLFGTGLGLMGLFGWRRRRKAAVGTV